MNFPNLLSRLLMLVTLTVLAGCAGQGIVGQGAFSEVSHDIDGVSRLEMHETGAVTIVPSDRNELVVRAQTNIHEALEVRANGDQLVVDTRSGTSISNQTRIEYRVYLPMVREVDLRGSFSLNGDGLTSDSLALKLSGAVDAELTDISVDQMTINTSGSGELALGGQADDVTVTSSGSLAMRASDLSTLTLRLRSSGSAYADVRVAEQLNVNSSGSASVRYYGQPRVNQSASGSASVEAAE